MNKKNLKIIALVALVAICCVALVACIPSDPDKAISHLKKAGFDAYKDEIATPITLAALGVKNIDCVVVGVSESDAITIVYFKDKSDANDAFEKIKKFAESKNKDSVIKKSGKVVYFGTNDAVKAAK